MATFRGEIAMRVLCLAWELQELINSHCLTWNKTWSRAYIIWQNHTHQDTHYLTVTPTDSINETKHATFVSPQKLEKRQFSQFKCGKYSSIITLAVPVSDARMTNMTAAILSILNVNLPHRVYRSPFGTLWCFLWGAILMEPDLRDLGFPTDKISFWS